MRLRLPYIGGIIPRNLYAEPVRGIGGQPVSIPLKLANASEYGLASYLYSRGFNRLPRVAEQIEVGMVAFNAAAPFGGIKQPGLGREGGSEGIAENATTQYIGIADPAW